MITLEYAQESLQAWLEAERALTQGRHYQIGRRTLTRTELSEVRKQIRFWQSEIARLKGRGRRRVMRVVPRDL